MSADGMNLNARAHGNPMITQGQVLGLLAYYMVLLVASLALLMVLIVDNGKFESKLLLVIGYVTTGALSGSVLYQIRMLFKAYIKKGDFDIRWLGKYITGPIEAVALSVAVLSIIQGGGAVLGGTKFTVSAENGFAGYGLGALIGFGIREVVGWLGNLARATFPTESGEAGEAKASRESKQLNDAIASKLVKDEKRANQAPVAVSQGKMEDAA